jgi:hypothetical protein
MNDDERILLFLYQFPCILLFLFSKRKWIWYIFDTGIYFWKLEFHIFEGFVVVRPNEPNQPDPTQPEFGPWGPNPTWLNPNLDPGGPTRPKIGLHYRVEPKFEPYLRSTQPDWTRFLSLRANPTRLNLNFGSKIGFNPKERVGFGRITL